jgi:hypothetical protein
MVWVYWIVVKKYRSIRPINFGIGLRVLSITLVCSVISKMEPKTPPSYYASTLHYLHHIIKPLACQMASQY